MHGHDTTWHDGLIGLLFFFRPINPSDMASLTLTQPCDRPAGLEVLYLVVWGDLRDKTNLDHPWSTTVRSTAGSELCRVVAATFFFSFGVLSERMRSTYGSAALSLGATFGLCTGRMCLLGGGDLAVWLRRFHCFDEESSRNWEYAQGVKGNFSI